MKVIKIITHPYTVIISLFIILINGEGWGGFFVLYLLFGLPYAVIHSLLALLGVVLLLVNYYKYKGKKEGLSNYVIEIIGVFLLMLSIFIFFYTDKQHYNYGTFYQLVPVITLILFTIIALSSIIVNIISVYKTAAKKSYHHLNV
jgi:hypothetical protein